MEIIDTKSMVEGNNYIVWYDFEFGNKPGIFILHMQGKRPLLKMCKQLFDSGKPIYFCEGLKDVWLNHRQLVGHFEDGMEIFRFVRESTKCH